MIIIHPEGDMNLCTKFHSNEPTNVNLTVALEEKPEDHQSLHRLGNMNVGTNVHGSPFNSCLDISV